MTWSISICSFGVILKLLFSVLNDLGHSWHLNDFFSCVFRWLVSDWFWQNFYLGKQIKHINSCFSIFLSPQIFSCSTLWDFLENVLSHWLHDIMGLLFCEHDFLCNFKLSFFEKTLEQYLHWWLEVRCFLRLNWSLSSKLQKEQVPMVKQDLDRK